MIRKKKPDYILTAAVIFGLVMGTFLGVVIGANWVMKYYNKNFIIIPKR